MKIAVICPKFKKSNINKLPWKYIYKMSCFLNKNNDIFILTDSKDKFHEIRTIRVDKLFVPLIGETKEVLDVLNKEKPDKCIMLVGLTSFLRNEFKISQPLIGIYTSPQYSFKELIRNIGIKDSLKYYKYTSIHYLNALIPNYFVKKWESKFEKIIFLSNDTLSKIVKRGLSREKAIFLPPGIDEEFLIPTGKEEIQKIKQKINKENIPVIMYFTSPLTLRGTDTLIKAFCKVRKKFSSKLIFLSRIDNSELLKEEEILTRIAEKEGIIDSIEIISKNLSQKQLRIYLSISKIICLPFKIVISDIPVSLLESMALGKTIVSTNVGCIPLILNGNGIIVKPNDSDDLADKLIKLLKNDHLLNEMENKSREFIENYPNWAKVEEKLKEKIENSYEIFED